ncbi:MAG: hypothetical protein AB1629_03510 [Candidatus Omnitrophota bacterium]
MASNQVIQVHFDAKVIELNRMERSPLSGEEGYIMDADPKWKLVLEVLPHMQKIPFQPGIRTCYIGDPELVFGVSAKHVSGKYRFSYTWNVDVSGKPEFTDFKATKIKNY